MITNQYTFNGDGQRVGIVDSQGTKKPIWDGENIVLETDGSDVTQVVYTLEPAGYGNLVSQRRGSTTSTHLFDALGSTRKLTDSTGGVTDSYDYRAYGETFASSGSTTNVFRWVGELGYYFDVDRDAYYLRARPYSPALARFISQDPLGFEGSEWNLYEYVVGQPTTLTDPRGLACGCKSIPLQDITDEAEKRRNRRNMFDSSHHCWAVSYLGAILGPPAAQAANYYGDCLEWWYPDPTSNADRNAHKRGVGCSWSAHLASLNPFGDCPEDVCDRCCGSRQRRF